MRWLGCFVAVAMVACCDSSNADEPLSLNPPLSLNAPRVGDIPTNTNPAVRSADDALPMPIRGSSPDGVKGDGFGKSVLMNVDAVVAKTTPPSSMSKSTPASFGITESQARNSIQWLAELAIKRAPRTYDGDKGWGDTREVWSGIKWEREGLRIRARKREKEVRHGRWVKYKLTLPEPDPSKPGGMTPRIQSVSKLSDWQPGVPADQQSHSQWQIVSSVETPMEFTARVERWNRGVQWYSVSIVGRMRVRLDSTTKVAFFADYTEVPPALVIDPKIEKAKLILQEFEVDRVSKIGGDLAEEWGELVETVVRDVFLKKQNEKLAGKLNKSVEKHRDDLRLSMADWLSTW